MLAFCTYITVHPATGKFYVGKSSTKKVLARYKGSGHVLQKAFKKYPKDEWECGILWEFETGDEALSDEGGIVTQELLDDPLCLNLILGGRTPSGKQHSESMTQAWGPDGKTRASRAATDAKPDVKARRTAAQLEVGQRPGQSELRSASAVSAWAAPGYKEWRAEATEGCWRTPEAQANLRAGQAKANAKPEVIANKIAAQNTPECLAKKAAARKANPQGEEWSVDDWITTYDGLRSLFEVLGQGKAGKYHPNLKRRKKVT